MTRTEGCRSTKYAEAEGLKPDLSCQLTWGMTMYTTMENMECGGTPMLGSTGVPDTKKNTEEECAQLCYMANAQFHEYNVGSFGAAPGNAGYCEAFEYNPNSRVCKLLQGVKPATMSGVNCHMSKELPAPCSFEPGTWVQDSTRQIYYVAKAHGELVSINEELTCFSEPIWGGEDKPASFACDGAVDANCQECIETSISHNKLLGPMTCQNLFTKVAHACQMDDVHIECEKGQIIQILQASYGRFDGGGATCATSPMPSLFAPEGLAGTIDNALVPVQTLCDKKNMCLFVADDKTLGTVPEGETMFKYVEVRYQCVEA